MRRRILAVVLLAPAPAIGIVAGAKLTSSWGVEIEVGKPTHTFTREYSGIGQTFAGPGAPMTEIERLGVLESFRTERTVRHTVSVGAVYQPHVADGLVVLAERSFCALPALIPGRRGQGCRTRSFSSR